MSTGQVNSRLEHRIWLKYDNQEAIIVRRIRFGKLSHLMWEF